jgi:YD repeat-containing protein
MSTRLLPGSGDPIYEVTATAPETFTLPAGFPSGRSVTVRRADFTAYAVTVIAPTGQTLDGITNGTCPIPPGTQVVFILRDPGTWQAYGKPGTAGPTGDLLAETVTYNGDGTVATSTIGGVTTTYTYDGTGNVLTEARNGRTKTYSYDGSGNVTGGTVA